MIDKDTLQKIIAHLQYLEIEYDISSPILDEMSELEHFENIELDFPDDQIRRSISIGNFLDYMSDIKSFHVVDNSTARTSHVRQTVISSKYGDYETFTKVLMSYTFISEHYQLRIVESPILIGIMNSMNSNYDDNYGVGSCDIYQAIEIKYTDDFRLTNEEENDLINRVLYYISNKVGTAVYVSDVIDIQNMYENDLDDAEDAEEHVINVDSLPQYCSLMPLFIQAQKAIDPEVRFLQFYKLIEYISPVVAKLTAYDKLNKRLDILQSVKRDYTYLNSLLDISRQYIQDLKDDSLTNSVVQKCVDVVPLLAMLPERLRKMIDKNLNLQKTSNLDIDLNENSLASLQRQVANIIYATRNSIVHAKSNYATTGLELSGEEMIKGNQMMEIIAKSIISWNLRQPEGLRV